MQSEASIFLDGTPQWVPFEDYDYDSDDFEQIGAALESETNIARVGTVGNAVCHLLPVKEGVDFALNWIEKNR